MAEDNRNEMNAIVGVLGDVLLELQAQREENRQNTERMINSFNTGFTKMLEKMNDITGEIKQIAQLDERLKQLEGRMDKLEGK